MTPIIKMTFGTIVVAGALHMPFDAAFAKKAHNKPAAAKTAVVKTAAVERTDINECAKLPAESRDRCISLSRPVTGALLYTQYKAAAADVAAASAAAAKARVAKFPRGSRSIGLIKDKPTNIADCAKLAVAQRDRCISLSAPVKGEVSAGKPTKVAAAVAATAAAAATATTTAKAEVARVTTAAKALVTGRDGRTDIAECGKVAPELRDRCISLSRPTKGADLAPKADKKSAAAAVAAEAAGKAKAAVGKATAQLKSVIRRDGTTDLSDCAKVSPDQRDACISRSRPVKGPVGINRT